MLHMEVKTRNDPASLFVCMEPSFGADDRGNPTLDGMVIHEWSRWPSPDQDPVKVRDGKAIVSLTECTHCVHGTLLDGPRDARLTPLVLKLHRFIPLWDKKFRIPVYHSDLLIMFKDDLPRFVVYFFGGPQEDLEELSLYAGALCLSFKTKVAGQRIRVVYSKAKFYALLKKQDLVDEGLLKEAEELLDFAEDFAAAVKGGQQ